MVFLATSSLFSALAIAVDPDTRGVANVGASFRVLVSGDIEVSSCCWFALSVVSWREDPATVEKESKCAMS